MGGGQKLSWVSLGTIIGDPKLRPEAHIFVGSKAPWYEITDDLPQFDEWPPVTSEFSSGLTNQEFFQSVL